MSSWLDTDVVVQLTAHTHNSLTFNEENSYVPVFAKKGF